MSSHPVISARHILFGDTAGRLWALDKEAGHAEWRHMVPEIRSSIWYQMSAHGRRLYFMRHVPISLKPDKNLPQRLHCYEEAARA